MRTQHTSGRSCLFALGLFSLIVFLGLGLLLAHTTYFNSINESVFYYCQQWRSPSLESFFVAASSIRSNTSAFLTLTPILLWLIYYRHLLAIIHLALCLTISEWFTVYFKELFAIARPTDGIKDLGFSYPSGHATLAFTFFIFIAWLFTQRIKGVQKILLFMALTIPALLVAFSRLYLGVHWLTDTIGGLCVGITINSLQVWIYRLHTNYNIRLNKWLALCVLLSVCLMTYDIFRHLPTDLTEYNALLEPLKTKALSLMKAQH